MLDLISCLRQAPESLYIGSTELYTLKMSRSQTDITGVIKHVKIIYSEYNLQLYIWPET